MRICRILGLVGCVSMLGFLIIIFNKEGIPNEPLEMFFFFSVLLTSFNFFPVPKSKDSLLVLWIESKKVKLRKEISDD
tara:strand:+ start:95 stop:328 length:234 start_codon:yes stop_codon:yes gene_type:complete